MREAIIRALEFLGLAFGGAGENAASLLAVKYFTRFKPVVIGGVIADVLRQRKPIIIFVGFGAIHIKDRHPVPPPPRTNRDPTTFVQRVYLLINILTTFFAWGVSHA